MGTFARLFAIALPVFLVIDLLWLGVVARTFYQDQMGHLMRESVNWAPAFLFYFIYVAGIVVLAVQPAVNSGGAGRAVFLGAVLGLVAYAAYDLTNLATMAGFPRTMAIVDLIWGTILTGSVSVITFLIYDRIF